MSRGETLSHPLAEQAKRLGGCLQRVIGSEPAARLSADREVCALSANQTAVAYRFSATQ